MTTTLIPLRSPILREPPQDVQDALLLRDQELAVLPAVAAEALQLANDPDCSMTAFSQLVERDLKLAADILMLANSAIYAPRIPVTSLNQAVVRLGFRQCKNLIVTSSLTSMMQRLTLEQQWIRDVLWRHCLCTALHCHHLNRVLGLGFQGEEFTAGLVHDLGRTLLAIALPQRFAEIDPLDFQEDQEILDRERSIAGIDHAEFGAWFVSRSGLPQCLIDVLLNHHDCRQATRLTALTSAGDHLANHLQRYLEPEEYQPDENQGIQRLAELGWQTAPARFRETAVTILEEAAKDLVDMTRRMS